MPQATTYRLRRAARWTAAAAATVLLIAPAASAADLRISTHEPVDSINPYNQLNGVSFALTASSYDLLLNFGLDPTEPDLERSLAESYDVSPDGLTWTFQLREGVTWSDGEPFDADDVVFTYRSVLENEANTLGGYLVNVTKVQRLDDHTVRLRLSNPDARLTTIFVPILPEHVFGDLPVDKLHTIEWPLPSVTTAPLRYVSYDKRGTTILEPNPRFRGEPARMDRLLMTRYGDREAQLRDLELGELDMVYAGNPRWIAGLEGNADIKVWSSPEPGFMELAFNSCPPGGAGTCSGPGDEVAVEVVQDPAIRQALAYGIDREAIARRVYAGQNAPAYGLISPYYERYFKDWSTDPEIGYDYDPERAKQILADGGWDCSSTPCTKDGVEASFEVMVRSTDDQDQSVMKLIRAWAAELGIDMQLSVVTEDAINNKVYASGEEEGTFEPTFDAFYWAWSGDPTPDFNFQVLRTGDDWQDVFYSNPAYDEASLAALRETQDFERRVELMHEAERIVMTDLPYIPTVHANHVYLTRTDTWHGWLASPPGSDGSPIGTNWQQITALQPGPDPAASEAAAAVTPGDDDGGGVPIVVLVLVGLVVVGGLAVVLLRRGGGGGGGSRDALEYPEE